MRVLCLRDRSLSLLSSIAADTSRCLFYLVLELDGVLLIHCSSSSVLMDRHVPSCHFTYRMFVVEADAQTAVSSAEQCAMFGGVFATMMMGMLTSM